jgi:MFS family permease
MTIVALLCVDRWGRRKFLITGASLMGFSLLVLGFVTHYETGESIVNPCQEELYCQIPSHNTSFNSYFLHISRSTDKLLLFVKK